MTSQRRAKVGGETGTNGEFYDGGKFLPTTARPKRDGSNRRAGPRKVEVEPFKWATAECGKRPIFAIVGTQARWIDRYDTAKGIEPDANGVAYHGAEHHGRPVADLCVLFNAGERWFAPAD